jgi:hypothetical protein
MRTVSFPPYRLAWLLMLLCAGRLTTGTAETAETANPTPDEDLWQAAAVAGHVAGVTAALTAGADPNARHPGNGQTAFMGAVLRGHTAVVDYLLQSDAGVDVGIPEKDGFTPAHGAGFQGRADILRLLWRSGRVNVVDDVHDGDGYSPFHRACWGREARHTETLRVWRDEIGIDLTLPAADGHTCADMTNNPATLALLAEAPSEDLLETEL